MSPGSGTVDSCKSSTSGQFVCFDVVVTSGWQMITTKININFYPRFMFIIIFL